MFFFIINMYDWFGMWDLVFTLFILFIFFFFSIFCLLFLRISVKFYIHWFLIYIYKVFVVNYSIGVVFFYKDNYNFRGIGLFFQHFYYFWFASGMLYMFCCLLFIVILEQSYLLYMYKCFCLVMCVSSFGLIFFYVFGCFCKLFLVFCFICYLFFFSFFIEKNCYISFDVFFLIFLSFFGILLMFTVTDLIFLYISLEIQSLCFYVLAAFRRHLFSLLDAGLKYYIVGSFASVLYVLGVACLYLETGFFELLQICMFTLIFRHSFAVFGGILCICFSLFFKVMIVPFHVWSVDVYDGSHILITTFFSVFPKLSIFYIIIYLFFYIFAGYFDITRYIFLICSLISIGYSTVACFVQYRIKRFLIFSSINHIGFCLVVLFSYTSLSVFSFFFYLFVYILITLCFWCIMIILVLSNFNSFVYLTDFSGLFLYNPYLAISLGIVLFTMMGLPPFIGFFSKLYIFIILFQSSYFFLVVILLLFTIFSCYYYLRILKFIFFEKRKSMIFIKPISNVVAVIICLFLVFFLFYYLFSGAVINVLFINYILLF